MLRPLNQQGTDIASLPMGIGWHRPVVGIAERAVNAGLKYESVVVSPACGRTVSEVRCKVKHCGVTDSVRCSSWTGSPIVQEFVGALAFRRVAAIKRQTWYFTYEESLAHQIADGPATVYVFGVHLDALIPAFPVDFASWRLCAFCVGKICEKFHALAPPECKKLAFPVGTVVAARPSENRNGVYFSGIDRLICCLAPVVCGLPDR